jgi:uncharacterized delta-60 repeat protein
MKKQLMIVLLVAISYLANAQAQLHVFEEWTTDAGTQNFFHKGVTKTDGSGNVYVAGATLNGSGNYDILVAKYNSSGIQQWIQQHNGYSNNHDFATAIFIDNSGNVYVTGTITDSLMTRGSDLATLKYNSSGTLQWYRLYNGSANFHDAGGDVVVDNGTGDIYVTGTIHTSTSFPNTDAVTIKYNSSGTQQWATIYNNSTYNLSETGARLRLTGTGKVVVSGAIQSAANTYIYGVLEYSTSTGAQIGGTALGSGSSDIEYFGNLQIDNNYNYYIAGASYNVGTTGYDYYIIKLDSTLAVQWENTYDGGYNQEDMANDIQVDASGNVYVTGYTTKTGEGKNITTLKYNSSGSFQWNVDYNDTLNGDDAAMAMTINASGEIYVTGYDSTYLGNYNYITLKYDASGNELWKIRYDGMSHQKDKATNICIDDSGDIVITGLSETAPATYEYITIKYVEKYIVTPTDAMGETASSSFLYYANKGQLISTDSTLIPDVKYYTNSTYPNYYFKNDTMSMVFASIDTIPATDDTLHRIDMAFISAKNNIKIYSMKEQSSYLNYFLGHCPDGVTGIHGNQNLIIPGLYEGIDLIYSSNQNGIKYYFVIQSGASPKDIYWKYFGATNTYHNSGTEELTITSDIGSITFDRPLMYQIDGNNDTINGSSRLITWLQDGADSYRFDDYDGYDSNEILIIEVDQGNGSMAAPAIDNLQWSTYYGGGGESFHDVKTDNLGNIYVVGYTGSFYFPVLNNIQLYQAGGIDMAILKFNNDGSRNWATFYGGDYDDEAFAVGCDVGGNVYAVGYAGANFPFKYPGGTAYCDSTHSGSFSSFDIAIVKLSPTGLVKLWATYFGAGDFERADDIVFDKLGNLYIVGSGDDYSNLDFYYQAGTFNDTVGKGLILKFKTDGTPKWITRFGGSASFCFINAACADNDGRIYIGGIISSGINFPIQNNPANGTYGGGSRDGFITKLDNSLNSNAVIWSSYYGGAGIDEIQDLNCDNNNNLLFVGQTSSDSVTFPLTDPVGMWDFYQGTHGGGVDDAFVGKIDINGNRVWSTYYGGSNYDAGLKLSIDTDNNIYMVGNSYGNALPIPTTNLSGGYFSPYKALKDGFVVCFTSFYKNIWSTYYGGNNNESAYGVATFQNTKLYLVGATNSDSTSFPIVDWSGAYYQPTLYGGNGYIAGFDLTPVMAVSVDDIVSSNSVDINVYPNPTNDYINIFVNSIQINDVNLVITNLLGQVVYQEKISNKKMNLSRQISLHSFADGMYIINVTLDDAVYSRKIIKN